METKSRDWMTVPELAEELRLPRTRAYALIAAGHLPAIRVGARSIRVNRKALETFLLEKRQVIAR